MDISFNEQDAIAQLGLQDSDPATQQHIISRLHELLQQRLGQRLQQEMSPADFETFAAVANDDQKARDWLSARFPEYQTWVAEDLQSIIASTRTQSDAAIEAVQAKRQQS